MSIAVKKFLEKNKIELHPGQYKIFETNDINQILSDYMVVNEGVNSKIYIKNIVGYDYSWRCESNDLFTSFHNYFDSEGDTYHSRANSMLNYSIYEMVSKLESSFKNEPIVLMEVDNNKYIVSNNGIHRFHILKIAYLGRIAKCNTQEEIDEVNSEFVIPCISQKIDVFKSYCNFILNSCKKEKYEKTFWISIDKDNPDLCNVEYNKEKIIVNNEQLLEFVINNINLELLDNYEMEFYQRKYPSFNEFLSNVKEKISKEKKNEIRNYR